VEATYQHLFPPHTAASTLTDEYVNTSSHIDQKAECGQLNLEHVTKNKKYTKHKN